MKKHLSIFGFLILLMTIALLLFMSCANILKATRGEGVAKEPLQAPTKTSKLFIIKNQGTRKVTYWLYVVKHPYMYVDPKPFNIAAGGIGPGKHLTIDVDWGFGQYIVILRIEGVKDLIKIPIKAGKIDETINVDDYIIGESPLKLPKKIPRGMKDA